MTVATTAQIQQFRDLVRMYDDEDQRVKAALIKHCHKGSTIPRLVQLVERKIAKG